MKRLTTNDPKDNMETAFNLFYIKDHEVWVRGGGLAPEYADISLFDFTRRAVAAHIPDTELPEDDDDLSMMMAEWLMDDISTAEGVLGLLYTAAWAYAELGHRLAAYEDTGLGPEEIVKMGMMFEDSKRYAGRLEGKLKAYEEAKAEGRLLVPPFKVGDTIYRSLVNYWQTEVVQYIGIDANGLYIGTNIATYREYHIGHILHFSREEVERAMEGGAADA